MNAELFAHHIGISVDDVQALFSLNRKEMLQNEYFLSLVSSIDAELLSASILSVRAVYDEQLPALVNHLRSNHGLTGKPMTSLTLGNWVIGFLHHPDDLFHLLDFHERVPAAIITEGLPHLLNMLDAVGEGALEWKKALVLLSLPLMASP